MEDGLQLFISEMGELDITEPRDGIHVSSHALIQHLWRRRRGKARVEAKADPRAAATRDAYTTGLHSNADVGSGCQSHFG